MAARAKAAPVTVDGIEVRVTPEHMQDIDVIEAIADVNDPSLDDVAAVVACVRLLRVTFGDDYDRVKRELRERNGGELTVEQMGDFFNRVAQALQAKNS